MLLQFLIENTSPLLSGVLLLLDFVGDRWVGNNLILFGLDFHFRKLVVGAWESDVGDWSNLRDRLEPRMIANVTDGNSLFGIDLQ